jgi:hypothetical protein
LRIARRDNGIRLYEPAANTHEPLEPAERLRNLVLLIAAILAPIPEKSLRSALQHLAHAAPALEGRHSAVGKLIASGDLETQVVDEVRYVWPAGKLIRKIAEEKVRFLAPFDPIVWDRRRFEHFWGWPYRFEAYTPAAKRKLGYYAMPLLWRDDVVGWVNVSNRGGHLDVQSGFSKGEIRDTSFRNEFEAEVDRLRRFFQPRKKLKKA